MTRFMVLLIALSFGSVSGCAYVEVYVDSIASPSSSDYTAYVLLSGKEGVTATDLHFQEYSTIVERALQAKGYEKADSRETADLAVLLNYGVSDPDLVPYSYSVPIYGQIGGGTTYHSGTVYGGGGGYATYSGTSQQMTQFGVVGSETHSGARTVYHRFLRLDALDLREYRATEAVEPVWKTTALSSGSGGDLRLIFPAHVAACMDYIATDTEKSRRVTVSLNSERVKMLKGDVDDRATTGERSDS